MSHLHLVPDYSAGLDRLHEFLDERHPTVHPSQRTTGTLNLYRCHHQRTGPFFMPADSSSEAELKFRELTKVVGTVTVRMVG